MTNRLIEAVPPANGLPGCGMTTEPSADDTAEMKLLKRATHMLCMITALTKQKAINPTIIADGLGHNGETLNMMTNLPCMCAECCPNKRDGMRKIGKDALKTFARIDVACLVSPAWAVGSKKPYLEGGVAPEDHPDKRYSVNINSIAANGSQATTWAEIELDDEGHIKPLAFYEPNKRINIEVDGLLEAFWEGVRGECKQADRPSLN